MRLPFLRPQSEAGGADRFASEADDPNTLQAARTHARRRLMGAVVLLLVAVVGFPLLFETQPRPLPGKAAGDASTVVIRTEGVARGSGAENPASRAEADKAAPAATAMTPAPAAAVANDAATERKAPASGPTAASAPPLLAAAPAVAVPPVAAAASKPLAAKKPEAAASAPAKPGATAPAAAKAASAAVAVAGKSDKTDKTDKVQKTDKAVPAAATASSPSTTAAAPAAGADGAARWVVQVGAYNDMERMRLARQKAEKLGFKTYTTEVETPTGKRTRVRLGPFAGKSEAEAAAAKVKANGMAANILSL
jgi:DedD protein